MRIVPGPYPSCDPEAGWQSDSIWHWLFCYSNAGLYMYSALDTNISAGFVRLLFFSSYFATDDTISVLRAANFTADIRGEVRFASNARYS